MFIELLTGVLLSNPKCMIEPTLINLHPNEYSRELHYYPLLHEKHDYRKKRIKNFNKQYIMRM